MRPWKRAFVRNASFGPKLRALRTRESHIEKSTIRNSAIFAARFRNSVAQ
jgi:hypothetical protein